MVASDLTARFGGRYDADSPVDSEAIFPYRFDASTVGAIAVFRPGQVETPTTFDATSLPLP